MPKSSSLFRRLPISVAMLIISNNFITSKQYIKLLIVISLLASFVFLVEDAKAEPFMFGVTIDDPWSKPNEIKDSLSSHVIKPTVRIVFDEWVEADEYRDAVSNIKSASFIMGEILDSFYLKDYTVQQYIDRTNEYLDEFEGSVDIWEIGNEVNGDWLGSTVDVVAKIEGAYEAVKARGLTTALNLYYNKSCVYDNPEHEMFTWVNANLSEDMRNGLDYVFFSYYEDDCEDVVHTQAEWQKAFDDLHTIFPNSKLGFGEIGTTQINKKAQYMHRYYELDIKGDYFVGGYFWWYYKQDCVPKTKEHYNTLNTIVDLKNKSDQKNLSYISYLLL